MRSKLNDEFNMSFPRISTLANLINYGLVDVTMAEPLSQVIDIFALAVSAQMHALIDPADPNDPIARQFIPRVEELVTTPTERADPIGDHSHEVVKGIIHRYPDRCLLMPVQVCAVYCRFCFRRETIAASKALTATELATAFTYIENQPGLWEVILTGGDPLILKPAALQVILARLTTIKHVEVIRIHTRIPIVDSARINPQLLAVLGSTRLTGTNPKPIYMVVHVNHAREFTPAAIKACALLVDAGIPLLSQTTLLKQVNDNIDALSDLMRCCIRNRIKPYYLHHCDLARGTSHFRTQIAEGQELVRCLRGRFSGICQPTYVIDIPGGYGKVPLTPGYLESRCNSTPAVYKITDNQGGQHDYVDDACNSATTSGSSI